MDPGASMLSSCRQVGKELHRNRMVSWPCKVYQGQLLQTRKGTVWFCSFKPSILRQPKSKRVDVNAAFTQLAKAAVECLSSRGIQCIKCVYLTYVVLKKACSC